VYWDIPNVNYHFLILLKYGNINISNISKNGIYTSLKDKISWFISIKSWEIHKTISSDQIQNFSNTEKFKVLVKKEYWSTQRNIVLSLKTSSGTINKIIIIL